MKCLELDCKGFMTHRRTYQGWSSIASSPRQVQAFSLRLLHHNDAEFVRSRMASHEGLLSQDRCVNL